MKQRNIANLNNILLDHIIYRIKTIPIPIVDVEDKLTWIYTTNGEYSVKTGICTNNDSIHPHTKEKTMNSISKLDLTPRLKNLYIETYS